MVQKWEYHYCFHYKNKIDNYKLGEYINIDGTDKYYGNGGINARSPDLIGDQYRLINGGYGGKGGNTTIINNGTDGLLGSDGVFILKYKNNDIDFIKNYLISGDDLKPKINTNTNTSNSIGLSVEPTADDPNYKLLVYKQIGDLNRLIINKDIICDVLIVGGGGAGGNGLEGGGGGGAGAVGMGTITLKSGTYIINIGNGGSVNNDGQPTIITSTTYDNFNITAYGGGLGGIHTNVGNSGGSGGGGTGYDGNRDGGTARKGLLTGISSNITFYGNNGGMGIWGDGGFSSGGGGGGGAQSNGGIGNIKNKNGAGNGGDGILSKITGTDTYYGGGGGGGGASGGQVNSSDSEADFNFGRGGKGGGGNGGGKRDNQENGKEHTGGGGGGSSIANGGTGGSGIVIFRVKREDIEEGLSKNDLYKIIDKDTRIINDIKDEFKKKIKNFEDNDMPYNNFSIFPLVILIILIWLFIFLFLLKFVHHYFVSIYLYILIFIIIFLLIFGSLWFLYTNNDLL
jgi:hypothetical protein